MYMIFVIKR